MYTSNFVFSRVYSLEVNSNFHFCQETWKLHWQHNHLLQQALHCLSLKWSIFFYLHFLLPPLSLLSLFFLSLCSVFSLYLLHFHPHSFSFSSLLLYLFLLLPLISLSFLFFLSILVSLPFHLSISILSHLTSFSPLSYFSPLPNNCIFPFSPLRNPSPLSNIFLSSINSCSSLYHIFLYPFFHLFIFPLSIHLSPLSPLSLPSLFVIFPFPHFLFLLSFS